MAAIPGNALRVLGVLLDPADLLALETTCREFRTRFREMPALWRSLGQIHTRRRAESISCKRDLVPRLQLERFLHPSERLLTGDEPIIKLALLGLNAQALRTAFLGERNARGSLGMRAVKLGSRVVKLQLWHGSGRDMHGMVYCTSPDKAQQGVEVASLNQVLERAWGDGDTTDEDIADNYHRGVDQQWLHVAVVQMAGQASDGLRRLAEQRGLGLHVIDPPRAPRPPRPPPEEGEAEGEAEEAGEEAGEATAEEAAAEAAEEAGATAGAELSANEAAQSAMRAIATRVLELMDLVDERHPRLPDEAPPTPPRRRRLSMPVKLVPAGVQQRIRRASEVRRMKQAGSTSCVVS